MELMLSYQKQETDVKGEPVDLRPIDRMCGSVT